MRIIAGTLKGRRLATPGWPGLRPTSDRLRETLFNVLGTEAAGARFADLCAGTGAVGIEAISRGAAHVTFVEADARACRLIRDNLSGVLVTEGYTILRSTVERATSSVSGGYDIVFLDPPYAEAAIEMLIEAAAGLVAPGGVLIVEHDRRRVLQERAGMLHRVRTLASGDSTLSFYRGPAPAEVVAAHVDAADA